MLPIKALFPSMERCLRWAWYEHGLRDSQTVKISSANKMIRTDQRDQIDEEKIVRNKRIDLDETPRGYDAAAQAGLIQSYVQNMEELGRAHLYSRYLLGIDRKAGQIYLRLKLPRVIETSKVKPGLLAALIGRYYGQRVRLKALTEKYNVTYHSVSSLNREVSMVLGAIAHRAESEAYGYLQRQGVVL